LSAFPGDEPPGRTSPYTTATAVCVDELREDVIEEDELYDTIEESNEEEWYDTIEEEWYDTIEESEEEWYDTIEESEEEWYDAVMSVEDREEGDRDTSFIQPRRIVKAKRSRISSHEQQMELVRPMLKRICISQDEESASKESTLVETSSEVVYRHTQMELVRPMLKRIRISQDEESASKEATLAETSSEVVSPPCTSDHLPNNHSDKDTSFMSSRSSLDFSAVIHEEEEEYGSVNEVEEEGDSSDTVNDISNQSSTNHHIMDSKIPHHPVVPTSESTPLASTLRPSPSFLAGKKQQGTSGAAMLRKNLGGDLSGIHKLTASLRKEKKMNRMIHPPLQKIVDGNLCSTPRNSSVTSTWNSAFLRKYCSKTAADNEPRVSGSSNETVCEGTAGNSGLAESKEKKKTKTPSSRMLRELESTLNSSYWMASGNRGSRRSRR
jgi:hypothetical protein